MNRTSQAEEILDYDPQIESYMNGDLGNKSRSLGRAIFGLMLLSGAVLVWFYGGLQRILDFAWLRTKYEVLGQSVPVWMGLSMVFLFFVAVLMARRRSSELEQELPD